MRLAIIPARGGSKRIPRKNIKPFAGKPIIAYSIDAALRSGLFDRVIVSTDDAEIAEVAKRYGADVPFMRPDALSGDHTGTLPVINHAIEAAEEMYREQYEEVCCIYATSPFIQVDYLTEGLGLLSESGYSFSATEYRFPIQRAFYLNENGNSQMFYPEEYQTRSQDLTPAYHDAGQFYWGKREAFLSGVPLIGSGAKPVFLPSYLVQDIDTPDDWTRAEFMYESVRSSNMMLCN